MEDLKKKNAADTNEKEIVFSQSIKAGKRIYYLDVKKNRKEEMFLSITESKRVTAEGDDSQVSFEKHKIFLYQEDFDKFLDGLRQAIGFIRKHGENTVGFKSGHASEDNLTKADESLQEDLSLKEDIHIDLDF